MARGETDRCIDQLAARQHGVFTYRQAVEAGANAALIHRRTRAGIWVRLEGPVFAVASAPRTWQRDLTAALYSRPGSLVCRRSSAALHQLPGFVHPNQPEIVIPYGGNARSRIATVRRSVYFDGLGREVVDGFPTVDVAETLFMVAGIVDEARLGRLVSHAITRKRTDFGALADIHVRHLGDTIPGIKRFERMIARHDPGAQAPPESELEQLLHRLVDHPEVPEAVAQHPLPWSQSPHRVDIYIPPWTLILEGDGRPWHTRVEDFERDRERDNLAAAHGIAVLRFTWRMLTREFDQSRQLLLQTGRLRASLR